MRLMPAAPSVMGMPTVSSSRSTALRAGGTSTAARSRRRSRNTVSTVRDSRDPAVTPAMAPAAHRDESAPRCSSTRHRARPMTSLPADSVIWLTAVGVMSPKPCVYPRMAEVRQTNSTAGPSVRMAGAASESWSRPLSTCGNRHMTALHTAPMTASSASAVRKIQRWALRLPCAAARDTNRDSASGNPAVDSTSSRL